MFRFVVAGAVSKHNTVALERAMDLIMFRPRRRVFYGIVGVEKFASQG